MANVDIDSCPSCQVLIERYGRDALVPCKFCGHLMVEESSCTCYAGQEGMQILIIQPDANKPNEIDIFAADGSVASLTPSSCGQEKYLLADLYQGRLTSPIKDYAEIWQRLGEGKLYNKEYKPTRVTKKVIAKVLKWLGFNLSKVAIEKIKGGTTEDHIKRINTLIKH